MEGDQKITIIVYLDNKFQDPNRKKHQSDLENSLNKPKVNLFNKTLESKSSDKSFVACIYG